MQMLSDEVSCFLYAVKVARQKHRLPECTCQSPQICQHVPNRDDHASTPSCVKTPRGAGYVAEQSTPSQVRPNAPCKRTHTIIWQPTMLELCLFVMQPPYKAVRRTKHTTHEKTPYFNPTAVNTQNSSFFLQC